ncbi:MULTISPECIES: helix-turn-helix transcriptional regulator [unclassified Mucilaginibacter]|uniref:helix-turn-helix domain-containing protein n=1 Tax=unclassified Mucilaginibacter TaxID=2617802 RepID=UPI0033973A00
MARGKDNDPGEHIQIMLKKVGQRIKELREAKGEPNYEKFAFKHDINRTQLWRYENGEDLHFSSLLKVLKALDVSLTDFFKEGFGQLE